MIAERLVFFLNLHFENDTADREWTCSLLSFDFCSGLCGSCAESLLPSVPSFADTELTPTFCWERAFLPRQPIRRLLSCGCVVAPAVLGPGSCTEETQTDIIQQTFVQCLLSLRQLTGISVRIWRHHCQAQVQFPFREAFLLPFCLPPTNFLSTTIPLVVVTQMVKNLPAMQETWVQSLGQEDPPEKGAATHCSILA